MIIYCLVFRSVKVYWIGSTFFVILVLFCCAGCLRLETENVLNNELSTNTPPAFLTQDPYQALIWTKWEISSHANTYDVEKGPNTYCARCHSPMNWNPSATIDEPPNCLSCKFPFEASPRVAKGNVLIPESKWMNIGCEICHPFENGVATSNIAWLNTQTGYHETVATVNLLCEKCHTDTKTLRHKRDLRDGAHDEFSCIDCHDPHSMWASCGADGCHSDVIAQRDLPSQNHIDIDDQELCLECHPKGLQSHRMEIQQGQNGRSDCFICHPDFRNLSNSDVAPIHHSAIHEVVSCVACHDASGLDVGPLDDLKRWVVFRTINLLGNPVTEKYQSHYLGRNVDCNKCHFPENKWGLVPLVPRTTP